MRGLSKTRNGFTLIELLIVVAIIGILATIVTVSLREASDRSRNTKIVTDVVQIRKVSEDMYIQEADGYTKLCVSGGLNTAYNDILQTLKDDIEIYAGAGSITCYSARYSYCASAKLTGSQAKWFCIDDDGNNAEGGANPCTDADSKCQ